MFFFRRFVMIIVLVLLPSQRNVQIVAQLWSTLYIMSYTAYVLPYKNLIQNVQEVINEWTVIVAAYHLFAFTEWVYDMERRMELGWTLIGTIVLNVAFNFAILGYYVISSCINKLKHKYRVKKRQKMILDYLKRKSIMNVNKAIVLESIKEEPEPEDGLKDISPRDALVEDSAQVQATDKPLLIAAKLQPLKPDHRIQVAPKPI